MKRFRLFALSLSAMTAVTLLYMAFRGESFFNANKYRSEEAHLKETEPEVSDSAVHLSSSVKGQILESEPDNSEIKNISSLIASGSDGSAGSGWYEEALNDIVPV